MICSLDTVMLLHLARYRAMASRSRGQPLFGDFTKMPSPWSRMTFLYMAATAEKGIFS